MKVLKKGRQQKGWSQECHCTGEGNGNGGCGAKLLVEQDDLFRTHSSAMGESTYYVTFRCSECGVMTDLDNSDTRGKVPSEVWANLKDGVHHPEGGYCHPKDLPPKAEEER
jgi:hypothetical protein